MVEQGHLETFLGVEPKDLQARHWEFVSFWNNDLMIFGVKEDSPHEAWQNFRSALLISQYTPVAFHHLNSQEESWCLNLAPVKMRPIF